jgi:DNA-binding transcriptional MerR regulator
MYDLDAKLPAHLAAAMVGVSRQLVNYWRSAGLLQPVGTRGRSPLYRLGDVLKVEQATRRSVQSRRRSA